MIQKSKNIRSLFEGLNIDGKRIFDIIIALFILLLTLPLTVLAIIGIKLTSPGSVFYRAQRIGQYGVAYEMHKLRTMHVHDGKDNIVITGPNDPRIFKFGNLLRTTKIDELPQFIDVLRGKMSVVGPRPEDPEIVEKYYNDEQKKTLEVKPGITSPAAIYYSTEADNKLDDDDVIGSYIDNVLSEKLKIEQDYIDKACLRYDLIIIKDTFLYVVKAIYGYISQKISQIRP